MFIFFTAGPALPRRARTGRSPQAATAAARTAATSSSTDPLAPFLVRLKIAGYGGLALALPVVMWQIWRFIVPGAATRTSARYAIPFIVAVGRAVRRSAASSPGSRSSKALEFLLGVGGDVDPAVHHGRQVPDARHADVRGVRRRVRVPAAARVPAAGRGREHPASSGTPGAGRPSGSSCSRRSSPRARTRSLYCSWPFPCTSSTRRAILIGRLMKR